MTDPDTIAHAAETGTRRDLLLALRRRLAGALDDERTQPRDLSPIVLRMKELAAEIEAIDSQDADEARDQLAVGDEPFDPSTI